MQSKMLEKYKRMWELVAEEALKEVDQHLQSNVRKLQSHLAFKDHLILTQNCGPFYGFALGEFPDHKGGVCVETSARVICVMNKYAIWGVSMVDVRIL